MTRSRLILGGAALAAVAAAAAYAGAVAADVYASRAPSVTFGPDGPWKTSLELGWSDGGPFLRARLSQFGLLALTRSESIYFLAKTDSDGRPLERGETYRIHGPAPAAAWWSITAYGKDYQLIESDGRYSVLSEGATGETDLLIGPQDDAGIATPGEGPLILTLRLYEPASTDREVISDLALPHIERIEP